MGHSEKKIFNKHFQGANSELNSLYFPRKTPSEFRRMAEFRKNPLNAMAQVFPLLFEVPEKRGVLGRKLPGKGWGGPGEKREKACAKKGSPYNEIPNAVKEQIVL